jgi:signal transduction histidine kinase
MNNANAQPRVIVVDDESAQLQALCEVLTGQGYATRGFGDPMQAISALQEDTADLLLADLMMPGMNGIELLRAALQIDPALAGIIMTGEGTISTAVEAMRSGAFDYVLKPLKLSTMLPVLERGLAMRRLRLQNAELERRLRERAAELEAANKELDAFTRSASHDLRSPLNGVLGFTNLLLTSAEARLSPDELGWLRNTDRAARQMVTLLDDLMRLSRLGRQSLQLKRVDVGALVTRVLVEIRQRDASAHHTDVSTGELPAVDADEGLLTQVFVNLLGNAFKFSRRASRALVSVGAEPRDGEWVYFVRDNGVGFDMAHASKLFDAFQRLPGAGDYEGSGVGLSIVQSIVSRHGGRIWAEAEPGHGACFRFTLGPPGRYKGTPDSR